MEMSGGFLVRQRFEEALVVPWNVKPVDISLQYWPNDNIITDSKGEVILNIFSMITPNDLAMFKDRPYWNLYFLHIAEKNKVVGISYMDPHYYEEGDYKRYPTTRTQMMLREKEVARHDDKHLTKLSNKEFRRKIYPDLYQN